MIYLRFLFSLLLIPGLIACDDKAGETYVDQQTAPQFDTIQPSNGIDQLKAQLLNNPDDFEALSRLGDMYFESAQYFEAIQAYDKAIAVNPLCADCYNDKGLALHYLGDSDSAVTAFNKAVEIDPGYVHAWLSKGFVLVSSGNYQLAVEPLNKVKELDTEGGLAAEADKFLAIISERNVQ